MTDVNSKDILAQFKREVKARIGENLKKIILFGSKARGDDGVDSDYDCLVLVDEVTPKVKDAIDEVAGDLLFEHNAVFSIFPLPEHVYMQKRFDPFLNNIRREGIAL
ncbi:MAG: nucleotidyltransferase domain-containing protein [bacterium]